MAEAEGTQDLATRRSRRSTAGNRMAAALAEMALEEANKDLDDDNEFVNDNDEDDLFESDFASTDEEDTNRADLHTDETAIHDEEKLARKAARARLEKRTAAAHDKNRATFNPQAVAPPVVKPKPKPKHLTTALVADGPVADGAPRRTGQKRKSQRIHTVLNTSATVTRLKETEDKKASAPKKFKPTVRCYSQAELIQRALDNEEGNIKEHKNYLKVEEEKRRKARTIKMPTVEGPLLRWVSKIEEEVFKVNVEVTPPQPPAPPAFTYTNHYEYYTNQLRQYLAAQPAPSTTNVTPQAQAEPTSQVSTSSLTSNPITVTAAPAAVPPIPSAGAPSTTTPTTSAAFSTFRLPTNHAVYPFTYYAPTPTSTVSRNPSSAFLPSFLTPTAPQPSPQPAQKQYVEEERTEKVTKNYVIHELDQQDAVAKPQWKDTMTAMFGDHVKWEELKVLSGKGRPLSRVKQRCLITGQTAPYLDPRTGVPFANVEAYKTISDILDHRYIWSPELGCYAGRDYEPRGP